MSAKRYSVVIRREIEIDVDVHEFEDVEERIEQDAERAVNSIKWSKAGYTTEVVETRDVSTRELQAEQE